MVGITLMTATDGSFSLWLRTWLSYRRHRQDDMKSDISWNSASFFILQNSYKNTAYCLTFDYIACKRQNENQVAKRNYKDYVPFAAVLFLSENNPSRPQGVFLPLTTDSNFSDGRTRSFAIWELKHPLVSISVCFDGFYSFACSDLNLDGNESQTPRSVLGLGQSAIT